MTININRELLTKFIGQQLKRVRIEAGLTQQEAALRAGYDPSNMNKLENGRRLPALETLLKFHKVYGLDYELFDRVIEMLEAEGIKVTTEDKDGGE